MSCFGSYPVERRGDVDKVSWLGPGRHRGNFRTNNIVDMKDRPDLHHDRTL